MKFRSLIFANLFRKKIRLILTIGSFAIALILFTFLAVVYSAFNRGIEIADDAGFVRGPGAGDSRSEICDA